MSTNRTKRTSAEQAPDTAPEQEQAPEQAPATTVSLAEQARDTAKVKATRVYRDITPRLLMPDGRLGCVQREIRADGTEGAHEIAFLTVKRGAPESAKRTDLEEIDDANRVFHAAGIALLSDPSKARD